MSWPWLKSASIVTGEPIVQDENRQSVAKLIQEHSKSIAELKEALQRDDPLFEPTKHDSLWLLRFLLSHKGKVGKALKAAQHTLQFRKEHKLDETDIRFQPIVKTNLKTKPFMEYTADGTFSFIVPDPERGVIAFLSIAGLDQDGILEHVSDEHVETFFITISEWTHQWLDYVTRTTGLLTRSVRIMDLQGITVQQFNRAAMKRNSKYITAMEDCYPQMLQTVFQCNAPAVVHGLWKIARPLLPQRLLDKMDFVNPEKRPEDVEKLLKHVDESFLPVRFGGKNEEWPVCVLLPSVAKS